MKRAAWALIRPLREVPRIMGMFKGRLLVTVCLRWSMLIPLGEVADRRARSDSRNIQWHAIERVLRRDVERLAVGTAPGEVVRVFWRLDRAQMFAVGGDHPDAAGAADVEVAALVDLDAVDGILAGRFGHVEEDFAVGRVALGVDVVTHDDLFLRIPVAD